MRQHSHENSYGSGEYKGRLIEKSQVTHRNVMIIAGALGLFALLTAFALYKWIVKGWPNLMEVFFDIFLALVIVERAQSRYVYEAGRKGMSFTKHSWLGRREYEVAYRDVMGVYLYKPKLFGILGFRRTYRLHSALDARDVWTVAYKARGWFGKEENRRIYFKPSPAMLSLLQDRMPKKVIVPEEQVVVNEIKREEENKGKTEN